MVINRVVVGENAKRAREINGFTQANIADFLKVDQSLISKFEKGERKLQVDILERLANLYGYRVSDFYCKEGLTEQRLRVSYRSTVLSFEDMEVIHDIKRIALNLFFMADLERGDNIER